MEPYFGFAGLHPTPEQRSQWWPNSDSRRRISSNTPSPELLIFVGISGKSYKCIWYIYQWIMDQYIRGCSRVGQLDRNHNHTFGKNKDKTRYDVDFYSWYIRT
jgi:hypothetical protein